jgi:hypothetical protein
MAQSSHEASEQTDPVARACSRNATIEAISARRRRIVIFGAPFREAARYNQCCGKALGCAIAPGA